MIKIVFEQESGLVNLDGNIHSIVDHCVEINLAGWHLLSISAVDTDYLQIKDILIEEISIGHMMLIMFMKESKQCTFGWVDHRQFCMPLNPNYAAFRSAVFSHIEQGDFGAQIYEKYDFALNNNPVLQHQYPKHIIDYFAQDTIPTWHKKFTVRSPWFLGPHVDFKKIENEIEQTESKFTLRKINLDSYSGWIDKTLKVNNVQQLQEAGLEYLAEILWQCNFDRLDNVNIGYLAPGGFISCHRDIRAGCQPRNKVYIPINFAPENYFKFTPGGYVALDSANAICLNTDCFLHAVINDSTSSRLIISGTGYADWGSQ